MTRALTPPLAPFVDPLPVPARLLAPQHDGRLTVPIRAGAHRFHRDLPESRIWGFDGTVPGPTIEADRGQQVTVEWRNELDGRLPVLVTVAPEATDADSVPVQCVPGLSGGTPDEHAAALSGHTVVHLHGGLTPASYDGWAENLFAPGRRPPIAEPLRPILLNEYMRQGRPTKGPVVTVSVISNKFGDRSRKAWGWKRAADDSWVPSGSPSPHSIRSPCMSAGTPMPAS